MGKRVFLAGLVAFFALAATQAHADYDKAAVSGVMKTNAALMGEISKAAEAKDFYAAAEKLMELAKGMKSLEAMTPENGKKEEWDKNHHALIKAAFKGIGACGDENIDELNAAIGAIGGLIKEGHALFK